eukprot:jgi/Ulvmu1/10863/UM007_0037.1
MCLQQCVRSGRPKSQISGTAPLLPPISTIEGVSLTDTSNGNIISSNSLWRDRGCVILAFRRPGCVLCRDEAVKIWRLKDTLDGMGLSVVGVVHECNMREIVSFRKYWPGPLYWDSSKAFYRALGNGRVLKGSILPLLNPFSKAWTNIRKAKQTGNVSDHNSTGDGYVMGGTLVVGQGSSGIFLSYIETTYGDTGSVQQVLDAATQAARSLPNASGG